MASTLTDIALHAGCSTSTVSRVLNNSGPVSERVRAKVETTVRHHGYVHRSGGRSLSSHRRLCEEAVILVYRPVPLRPPTAGTKEGVQVSASSPIALDDDPSSSFQVVHGFYHMVMDGLTEECRRWEIATEVITCRSLDDPRLAEKRRSKAGKNLLFVGPYRSEVKDFADKTESPMVLVGINCPSRHDAITIDNHGGIRQALEHLVSLGHRDIGFVGTYGLPDFEERRFAFNAYAREFGVNLKESWINLGSVQVGDVADRTSKLLSQPDRPTALVCGNDLTAMSTIQGAHRCGLRVPDDLSVVGFDSLPVAELASPPLTSIHVPMEQIGRIAVRQLVIRDSCSETESYNGCITRVSTELKVRQSTARPHSI